MIVAAAFAHPFGTLDLVQLLRDGKSLPEDRLAQVGPYAEALGEQIPESSLVAPRGANMTIWRGMTTSLVVLAHDELGAIQAAYKTYDPKEHLAVAALFFGFEAMVRARAMRSPTASATPEGADAARRRSWTTVEDATSALLAMEGTLVRHGEAVLRQAPELHSRFVADDALQSYEDVLSDVQRRLDFMASPEFAVHFAASPRTSRLREDALSLLADAHQFRIAREGAAADSVTLTTHRNVLFTALMAGHAHLQAVLRAALENQPDMQARVEAEYWKSQAKLTRKAKRREPPEDTPADGTQAAPEKPK